MKVVLWFLMMFMPLMANASSVNEEQLFHRLDSYIAQRSKFTQRKEAKLLRLKKQLYMTSDKRSQLSLYNQIYREYYTYRYDSAMTYAKKGYQLAEEEAANFYIRFDKAFIDLYPNFVEEFNQLLLPEKQIVLPAPNSLTKELRIYALMRLGITDGQELATLLFYSTQTIYNYKAAIRKRAKDLTTFDAAINRLCNVIG